MTSHYSGPLQIASAALCCFCAGSLYGWSALIPIIERTLTKSTGQAGLIFSFAIVSFTIAVFTIPRLPPSLQQLSGCTVFGILGAICLSIASQSTSYLMFVIFFSAGFGAASGAIYINALSIASKSKHPKISAPIVIASFGLGGAVFGPIWRLLAAQGWDLSALLPASAALACSAFLTIGANHQSFTAPAGKNSSEPVSTKTVPLSSHSKHLVAMICLTFGLGSMAGLMVLGLASKIIDVAQGSVLLSTIAIVGVSVGNTSGRLSVSIITLRYTAIQSVIGATVVISVGLIFIAMTTSGNASSLMVISGLTVVALGYGIIASAVPTLVRTVFEEARFSKVFSIVFLAWGLAGLTAPWIAGIIFDHAGSFQPAIIGALLLTLCALLTAIKIQSRL